jgi:prophage regulatory protein
MQVLPSDSKLYYRQRDLTSRILPFSASTLWRRIRAGAFPAPVRFGAITAWRASEVHDWLQSQQANPSHDASLR